MSAADFATSRRGGITRECLAYARAAMRSGHGYQAAAAMIGCSEITLRERLPDMRPARQPIPRYSPRTPPAPVVCINAPLPEIVVAKPVNPNQRAASQVRRPGHKIMARDILDLVGFHYGIAPTVMISAKRSRPIARPRQRAWLLIREYRPNVSLPEIGRLTGGRDHTTVLHGIRHIAELAATSPEEAAELDALRAIIEARIADGVAG
jgi:hypothetical protein